MATTYFYRTPTAGNRRTWTFSAWVKRGTLGARQGIYNVNGGSNPYNMFEFIATDALKLEDYDGGTDTELITTRLFRDVGAWYHIVVAYDTTQATPADRIKLYVNGVQETDFSTETYCAQDFDTEMNTTVQVDFGKEQSNYFDGVMAHAHLTDGTAYAPTAFGEFDTTSGIWVAKTGPSVTYGTNGFFLKFASGALGTDSSGEGNNMTVSGTMTNTKDTPDNNFATINPLDNYLQAATFSNGNNTIVTGSDKYPPSTSTIGMTSGKWYWETKAVARGGSSEYLVGISSTQYTLVAQELGNMDNDWGYYSSNGNYRNENSNTAYGDTYDTGDIIGCAVDLTNLKLYFSKNGVWQNSGVPTSGATGTGAISITAVASTPLEAYFAAISYWGASTGTFNTNFGNGYFGTTAISSGNADDAGEGDFEYDVPAGYYALCTNNLGDQS